MARKQKIKESDENLKSAKVEAENDKDKTTSTQKSEDKAPEDELIENKHTKKKEKSGKRSGKSKKEVELQEKLDEINDKYIRLYSEFDNYRRRTIKERIELSKTASEEVISDLLPIVDDFERAMKSLEDSSDCDAVKEGMQLIYSKLIGTLEKKGLNRIEAIGEEFNTDLHEAITYIPAEDKKMKGKIVDEIEKGYKLGDKVIRYTKVIIGQ